MPSGAGARAAPLEAVLFDAGGVLLDLDYAYLRRLLQARRHDVSHGELARAEAVARRERERAARSGPCGTNLWRDYFHTLLAAVRVPPVEHAGIIDSLWEAHERVGLWGVAIEGARETVQEVRRRGYRVGVVSNAEGQVARDLDNAGFAGVFETVVDSHLVGVEKPDPRIFAIALERMKLAPDATAFVGDLPAVDIDGARAAGITPILLDRHGLYPDHAAPRIESLSALPSLLERHMGGDAAAARSRRRQD